MLHPKASHATFVLGQIFATPSVLEAISQSGETPADFLQRHAAGDWGCVPPGDAQLNDQATLDGSRILSAYQTRQGVKLWVITEAADETGHRVATTMLLPHEY